MAYNIDTAKIKRLESLVIPLDQLYVHEREDWHPTQPKILNADTMEVEIKGAFEQTIKGLLKDGQLHVTEMDLQGEGSGTFRNWILDPALKKSTGILEASFVWEGGDSITKLTVNNGDLKEVEVEI